MAMLRRLCWPQQKNDLCDNRPILSIISEELLSLNDQPIQKTFFSGFTYIIFLRRKYNPGNHIFVLLCSPLLCEINALGLCENNL